MSLHSSSLTRVFKHKGDVLPETYELRSVIAWTDQPD